MKHTLVLLAVCLIAIQARSQVTTGKVIYEEAVQINAPDDLPAEASPLRDFFSQGMRFTRVLSFNADASLYKSEQQDEKQMSGSTDDGMQIQFKMQVPEESTHTDLKSGAVVEQKDLMGKKFLIGGAGAKRAWKMTGKQKMVLNYPCQQAIAYGRDTVTVWFTTVIPVSAGPQDWRGLPGLILEGSQGREGGSFTITAKKVEENAAVKIAPPTAGKKVTKEEYLAIEKEKQKEMEQQYGGARGGPGGGNSGMMIHIER